MPISNCLPRAAFLALDWNPYVKQTLQGFFTVEMPSGLRIHKCSLHERDGQRWIGLPAQEWQKPDKTKGYTQILEFRDAKSRARFQESALSAIEQLLAASGGAA